MRFDLLIRFHAAGSRLGTAYARPQDGKATWHARFLTISRNLRKQSRRTAHSIKQALLNGRLIECDLMATTVLGLRLAVRGYWIRHVCFARLPQNPACKMRGV